MGNFLKAVFSDQFMPHGYCFLWRPELVWMHAITDLIIALSYFAIPLTIIILVRKSNNQIPFAWVFWMFAAFIFLCGLTHIMELIGIWHSLYYLEGVIKIFTAAVSFATALVMFPLIPVLLDRLRELEEFMRSKKED